MIEIGCRNKEKFWEGFFGRLGVRAGNDFEWTELND